jgi:predicted kinase
MTGRIEERTAGTRADALVVLAGLPGTGKSTIARLLARRLGAVYLRTDAIAGPMLTNGLTRDPASAGRVAYNIARDVAIENLRIGRSVVVDGVHATHARRALWRRVGDEVSVTVVGLEITVPDAAEHRRRLDRRRAQDSLSPTWEQVAEMEYDAWSEPVDGRRLLVDATDTDAALAACLAYLMEDPA